MIVTFIFADGSTKKVDFSGDFCTALPSKVAVAGHIMPYETFKRVFEIGWHNGQLAEVE